MGNVKIRLDHAGIRQLLQSAQVAAVVEEVAQGVADSVRGELGGKTPPVDVVVDTYTTDRAAAAVTIRDVRGRIYQSRDGVLTRAAAAHGLEVRER